MSGYFKTTIVNSVPEIEHKGLNISPKYRNLLNQMDKLNEGQALRIGGNDYTEIQIANISASLRHHFRKTNCKVIVRKKFIYLTKSNNAEK